LLQRDIQSMAFSSCSCWSCIKLPVNRVAGHLCSRCSTVCGCCAQCLQVGCFLCPRLCKQCVAITEWIRTFIELEIIYKYGSVARTVVSKSESKMPEMIVKTFLKAKRNQHDTKQAPMQNAFSSLGLKNCGLNSTICRVVSIAILYCNTQYCQYRFQYCQSIAILFENIYLYWYCQYFF